MQSKGCRTRIAVQHVRVARRKDGEAQVLEENCSKQHRQPKRETRANARRLRCVRAKPLNVHTHTHTHTHTHAHTHTHTTMQLTTTQARACAHARMSPTRAHPLPGQTSGYLSTLWLYMRYHTTMVTAKKTSPSTSATRCESMGYLHWFFARQAAGQRVCVQRGQQAGRGGG